MKQRKPYLLNHPYTCPLLMLMQSWLLWQSWHFDNYDGWRLMKSPRVVALCMFPHWLIKLECRFWGTRVGIYTMVLVRDRNFSMIRAHLGGEL